MKYSINIAKLGELDEIFNTFEYLEKEFFSLVGLKFRNYLDEGQSLDNNSEYRNKNKLKLITVAKDLFEEKLFSKAFHEHREKAQQSVIANDILVIDLEALDGIDVKLLVEENYLIECISISLTSDEKTIIVDALKYYVSNNSTNSLVMKNLPQDIINKLYAQL